MRTDDFNSQIKEKIDANLNALKTRAEDYNQLSIELERSLSQ
jgi:hypothetical protein